MSTWIKVARFHLVDRFSYTALPWGVLAFALTMSLFLAASAAGSNAQKVPDFGLAAIYLFFFIIGVQAIGRSLPFALALGVGRRSYYTGTALLAVSFAAVYGLALAVLQAIERATGGWGLDLHFFQVAYILAGPWYLTWLTSFVLLALIKQVVKEVANPGDRPALRPAGIPISTLERTLRLVQHPLQLAHRADLRKVRFAQVHLVAVFQCAH